MADSQLTCEEIRQYFLANGGKVSNRDALRHFKRYLTDPVTQESARSLFKYYVNKLATIRTENNEKCLILRLKYFNSPADFPNPPPHIPRSPPPPQVPPSPPPSVLTPSPSNLYQDTINSIGIPMTSPSIHMSSSPIYGYHSPSNESPIRQPPPYRSPPPFTPSPRPESPGAMSQKMTSLCSSNLSLQDSGMDSASQISSCETPKVPPRRRSADKMSIPSKPIDIPKENIKPSDKDDQVDKEVVSVKERMEKFNRLASVDDELSPSPKKAPPKNSEKGAEDHDDGVSVTSLEPKKCREWYVTAAKADYLALSKLASEEPLLVKVKDPFSTVLHWAAKHGNSNIIKLFAGKYKANVNARTNGGYTPLHLAAQYGHDEVFELLIKVYKADFNIADFSGRTPEKYRLLTDVNQNQKTIQKYKGRKKQSDKDRFLRIGSLNVRVKKTTEAFSNFLGVGGSATISNPSQIDPISEKVHKGWGSADNVQKNNTMPAPKSYTTKRKHKRIDSTPILATSNPGTPQQPLRSRQHQRHSLQDSDSDTAAGFDSQWHYPLQ